MIAKTPKTPYYAVIFTSLLTEEQEGYTDMAFLMEQLSGKQKGFLGIESAREGVGITVSYWSDLESIKQWKAQSKHLIAQGKGKTHWYQQYHVRIAKVERDYNFNKSSQ